MSDAQDLISPYLSNHHQQVAYLSYRIARIMDLPLEMQKDIFLAGLVHDIGALSKSERLEIIENEPLYINNHAFVGAKILEDFKPLKNSSNIIKYHHISWNYGEGKSYKKNPIPIGSHIIHIADRTCTLIRADQNILSQIPKIIKIISGKSDIVFMPQLVSALVDLTKDEYIWLDLISGAPVDKVNIDLFDIVELKMEDVIEFSRIYSHIIDFRSSFTARHSAGVAIIAEKLAKLVGFSPIECKMMLVAGYLHDLGKLAIDNSVLEKPTKLNADEFNEIRSHTYFTYQLLDRIPQFRIINEWASYHHERLDGNGYPFHINGVNLSLGSRIMAVADVFTAITENRPYRQGMNDQHAIEVLNDMVSDGGLDEKIVGILIDNFKHINQLREEAQEIAAQKYSQFLAV